MMTEIGNKGKAEIFTYENHDDSTDCSEDPDSQQEVSLWNVVFKTGVLCNKITVDLSSSTQTVQWIVRLY